MAKKISRLLMNEAREKMTDEDFFKSVIMRNHFESIIEGVCKTFKKRIRIVIINSGDRIAYTSGETITINLNAEWVKDAKTRAEKYYIIVGVILHECAHVLYTDFRLMGTSEKALLDNRLFPKIEISEELEKFFEDNKGRRFQRIYHTLDNCIEDGHIEKRILKYVPGYGECLMKVRQIHREEHLLNTYENAKKDAEKEGIKIDRIAALLNLTLVYAKYGIENTGEENDSLTEAFDDMKEAIDKAVNINNSALRKTQVNIVFDKLVAFIADEITNPEEPPKPEPKDESSKEPESKEESEESSSEENPSEKEDKETEGDTEGSASTETGEDDPEEDSLGGRFEDDLKSDDSTDSESSVEECKSEMSPEEISEKLDEVMSKLDEMCDDMDDMSDHTEADTSPTEEAEVADSVDEATGEEGKDTDPSAIEGPEDWDLSYLEDEAVKEEAAKIIKKGIEKTLAKIGDDTRKDRIDKYPSIETYVEPDSVAEEMYEEQHEELDRIARRVVKSLDRVIKERQKGDKLTGLYSGQRLDSAHAYRKDKRIFSNKILPEDVPDMEVCVLVDCSGSMTCGSRMSQSRKCAYITWKFCQQMEIPCSVYGHTTDWPDEQHVLINCVAHPDNADKDDAKRIFMLRPYANNRDGWAVNFCCEALERSGAASKLLLIISDGLPAADGYGFILGKKDCQDVVKKYKRKGISVITAGIDDCAEDIKGVYCDGVSSKDSAKFLDFTDMSQLPKAFAEIIRKELL